MVETTSRMASSSSTTRIFSMASVCTLQGSRLPLYERSHPLRSTVAHSENSMLASQKSRYLVPRTLFSGRSRLVWSGIIAFPLGRRRSVFENQGLSAVAFFEVTAFLILLVLFILLRKDHPTRFLAIWMTDWSLITVKASLELSRAPCEAPQVRL